MDTEVGGQPPLEHHLVLTVYADDTGIRFAIVDGDGVEIDLDDGEELASGLVQDDLDFEAAALELARRAERWLCRRHRQLHELAGGPR